MAQVKSRQYPQLECGDIYFLYRPAVVVDEAHGFKDVRRLYTLLKPSGNHLYRLLIVGRKKLPAPEEHDRFWAFVWRVQMYAVLMPNSSMRPSLPARPSFRQSRSSMSCDAPRVLIGFTG
jgi:hypothetical protein